MLPACRLAIRTLLLVLLQFDNLMCYRSIHRNGAQIAVCNHDHDNQPHERGRRPGTGRHPVTCASFTRYLRGYRIMYQLLFQRHNITAFKKKSFLILWTEKFNTNFTTLCNPLTVPSFTVKLMFSSQAVIFDFYSSLTSLNQTHSTPVGTTEQRETRTPLCTMCCCDFSVTRTCRKMRDSQIFLNPL